MHVIVFGAGEVGLYVSERLVREGHDVALVDKDPSRIADAQERLDVETVLGAGSNPGVLEQAGLNKAALLVAVTNDDEANLIAAVMAKNAGVETTIVRLQSDELRSAASGKLRKTLGVDHVIDPDAETAQEIFELLRFPGASEIFPMVGGEVMIVGARLGPEAPAVGQTLRDLAQAYEPHWE